MGMRVQLQEQSGGKTIHHASIVLDGAASGMVTTAELANALEELRKSPAIPSREQRRADTALDRALQWTRTRPPAGVSGRFSKCFCFDPQHPGSSFRFDIEGITGVHLKV